MQSKATSAVVVVWAVFSAPPLLHAFQHQHGEAPPATRADPSRKRHEDPRINLKDVLKAAERSLGALEKAARRGPGPNGEQAARDYVSLVGWVERHFVDMRERGVVEPRDADRARKSLAAQTRRLAAVSHAEPGSGTGTLVEQAQKAASAAVTAIAAASPVATPP